MWGVLGDVRVLGDVGDIGRCERYWEMWGVLGDVRDIGRCERDWEM